MMDLVTRRDSVMIMRLPLLLGSLLVASSAVASPAASIPVEGMVVDAHSHWTADGSRIVTEATVRTSHGDVVVSQLGGSAGGYGMRTFPGPEIMTPGMRVAIAANQRLDLSQRAHLVADDLRVLDY